MPSRVSLFLNSTLVLLVAALAVMNWKSATLPIDTTPVAYKAGQVPGAAASAPPALVFADIPGSLDVEETLARPLFNPSRRPVLESEPLDAAEAVEEKPLVSENAIVAPLVLAGVMRIGARDHRALVRADDKSAGVWLAVGGELAGWRLTEIDDELVIVEKTGLTRRLMLRRPSAQTGN